jgi:hypothetical protein
VADAWSVGRRTTRALDLAVGATVATEAKRALANAPLRTLDVAPALRARSATLRVRNDSGDAQRPPSRSRSRRSSIRP